VINSANLEIVDRVGTLSLFNKIKIYKTLVVEKVTTQSRLVLSGPKK